MQDQRIQQAFEAKKSQDLLYSIIIDLIGMGSYVIPVLAESFDVILAPLSAIAIYALHKTPVGAIGGFVEEILPGTDFIPTASIIWYHRYRMNGDQTFQEYASKKIGNDHTYKLGPDQEEA